MPLHQLDRGQARRIAIRAQLLDARPPADLLAVVNQLTFLQLDPTAAVAPSADLVAWTRLGAAYQPAHRNVTQMLEFLSARGEIAVSGRQGRQRVWDLAERVYPADTPVVPLAEAVRVRDQRRLRSLGIARASAVGEAGEPVEVEATSGEWRVDPALGLADVSGLPTATR